MGALQPWHIILIVVVFLLLFGGKRLPDAARGLGRSLRILKSEVGAMHEEDGKVKPTSETDLSAAVPTAPSQIAPVPGVYPAVQVPTAAVPVPNTAVPVPNTAVPAGSPMVAPGANGSIPAPSQSFHAPGAHPAAMPVPAPTIQPGSNLPLNGQPY